MRKITEMDNIINTHSEQEFITRLIAGDMPSYERLYELYYPIYLSFARRLLREEDVAEDVVQNVFMKVWLHRADLKIDKSIKAYLFVLTKREVIDVWRRKRRSEISIQDIKELICLDDEIEQNLEYRQVLTSVNRAVDEMPLQRKMIFTLSRYDNCSNKEIADRLNISIRTVEKHIELAVKFIKRSVTSYTLE